MAWFIRITADCQLSAMMLFRALSRPAGKSGADRFASSLMFQVAESMGFKGDFRQWEDLLRVGD
jgi:hypothetical protein